LEVFYGLERKGEVKTAGGSVVAYERWRETQDQEVLKEIVDYNRVDCISTEKLRDWLVSIRPEGPWPQGKQTPSDKDVIDDADSVSLRAQLATAKLTPERQDMLFNLGMFHKREVKPAWWAIFESLKREEDELIDDLDALAGLMATAPATPIARSQQRTYSFPEQETKIRAGKKATVPTLDGSGTVTVEMFDGSTRTITLKVGNARADLLENHLTLHPEPPIGTDAIAAALRDVIADQCGLKQYRAIEDLLSRANPRLIGKSGDILGDAELVEGVVAAVQAMDHTVLAVQGPPGTGKTYVSANAILSLVRRGFRVGVTSNSHEAIRNVLLGCVDAVDKKIDDLKIIHKVSDADYAYPAA
jgi:hypothetical protein